jgi:hypothetical protein
MSDKAISRTDPLHAERCTIYHKGAFGVQRLEARWMNAYHAKYAQHPQALHVEFVQRGKRKRQMYVPSYKPFVLILSGYDNPTPPDPFRETESGSMITRRASFDDGWITEFNEFIAPHLANGAIVLLDVREGP